MAMKYMDCLEWDNSVLKENDCHMFDNSLDFQEGDLVVHERYMSNMWGLLMHSTFWGRVQCCISAAVNVEGGECLTHGQGVEELALKSQRRKDYAWKRGVDIGNTQMFEGRPWVNALLVNELLVTFRARRTLGTSPPKLGANSLDSSAPSSRPVQNSQPSQEGKSFQVDNMVVLS